MGFSPWILAIVLRHLAAGIFAQPAPTGTVSILNAPNFSAQRECAQQQFGGNCGVCFDLAGALDCPVPYLNGCFCRSELTSSALSILSQRVWPNCNYNSADLETALGIYSACCDVTAAATVVASTTTSAAGAITLGQESTGANTPSSNAPATSSTNTSSSGSSGGGGLSPGAISGISVAGFVVAVLGVGLTWRQLQIMRRRA